MKTLSYTCIALAAIALTFSSCKKSSNPTPNNTVSSSMKFTSNGSVVSFNNCGEVSASVNGITQTLFTGINVTNGTPGDVNFEINIQHDPATFQAGQTYQVTSLPGHADAATFYYSTNSTDEFTSQPTNTQGSVSITGVTSTTISGTFSGKLFAYDDYAGATVVYTITNGSFTAKRQ